MSHKMVTYEKSQKIVIIGTGGTIAGRGASDTDLTGYTAGVVTIESLLTEIPALAEEGPLESIQFSNIESSNITMTDWIGLARLVEREAARADVDGIVITHGTDSMEETAYFLNLTVHTRKPVVITGAMRPSGALSADGPLNLLTAIQVSRDSLSYNRGVLVLMNNRIFGAREVTKSNTTNVDTFVSPEYGQLGTVQDGVVFFFHQTERVHTADSVFDVGKLDSLPNVALLYAYAGMDSAMLTGVLASNPDGLVVAGLGHGTIPLQIREGLKSFHKPIIRASRTGSGLVTAVPSDAELSLLPSGNLHPVKARILLMLAISVTKERDCISKYIATY